MFFSTYRFAQWALAFCIAAFTVSFAVIAATGFTPLYYFDARYLQLAGQSGISYDQIVENYNYIILYLLNPLPQTFELPSLAFSTGGRLHFQDVKHLFTAIECIMLIAIPCAIIGIRKSISRHDYFFLKKSAIVLILFTAMMLFFFAVNFEQTFILFHKLFFRNDYWLFDPRTDPIIMILPETFFLHAALFILGIIAFSITALLFLYKKQSVQK